MLLMYSTYSVIYVCVGEVLHVSCAASIIILLLMRIRCASDYSFVLIMKRA